MRSNKLMSMALAISGLFGSESNNREESNIRLGRAPGSNRNTEPQPQKGQFTYWFWPDSTFLTSKKSQNGEPGLFVFKCYAINDKNAIKKYNAFVRANQ